MRQDHFEIALEPISEVWVSTELIERKDHQAANWQPTYLKLLFFIGAIFLTFLHSAMCAILIAFKYTESTILTLDASHAGKLLFWQFVPTTLAIITGLTWEVIYIEVCRLQPYRDLASPQGSNLTNSLSQVYLTSFSWFVPYQALKHPKKYTGVALTSMAYLLSYAVLLAITIAMIKIQWDDDVTEGTAQPLIYLVVISLVVSISQQHLGSQLS